MKILLLYLSLLSGVWHPIKMTTSKVAYLSESSQFEVGINFFWDDFEQVLIEKYNLMEDHLDLADSVSLSFLEDYINKRFILENRNNKIELSIISAQTISDNVIKVNLRTENMKGDFIQTLKITNTLLIESFPKDQVNLTKIEISNSGDNEMLRFSREESIQQLELNFKCE